jgi:hypothetical protein
MAESVNSGCGVCTPWRALRVVLAATAFLAVTALLLLGLPSRLALRVLVVTATVVLATNIAHSVTRVNNK